MASNKELISVYLDSEIKEKLQKKADKEERSMSFIAAKIIEKALKEEESNGWSHQSNPRHHSDRGH